MHIDLRIDGMTVVDEELDLRSLINRLKDAEEYGLWSSSPLTFEQAKNLVSRLDTRTLELVRQVVFRGGSITWPHAAQICGIVTGDFYEFDQQWLRPLNRVVATVLDAEFGALIVWIPDTPEWDADDMADVKFYLDGPALRSLRKVFIGP